MRFRIGMYTGSQECHISMVGSDHVSVNGGDQEQLDEKRKDVTVRLASSLFTRAEGARDGTFSPSIVN